MPTTDLLKTFGLSRNPFTDRTAEKTDLDDVSLYIHSDLRGFKPSETTYVFFGARGSGKTTIRLQMEEAYAEYNAKCGPHSKGHFIVDMCNPGHLTACLRTLQDNLGASIESWDATFSDSWESDDLLDCMLSYAATVLVQQISAPGSEARSMIEALRADPSAARHFLLLTHLYARTDQAKLVHIRRVLLEREWNAAQAVAVAGASVLAAGGLALSSRKWGTSDAITDSLDSAWNKVEDAVPQLRAHPRALAASVTSAALFGLWYYRRCRRLTSVERAVALQRSIRVVKPQPPEAVGALLLRLFSPQDSLDTIRSLTVGVSAHEKLDALQRLVQTLGYESLAVFGDCFDEVTLLDPVRFPAAVKTFAREVCRNDILNFGRLHFFFPNSRLALDLNTDKTLKEARFDRHFVRDLSWSRHQLEELAERRFRAAQQQLKSDLLASPIGAVALDSDVQDTSFSDLFKKVRGEEFSAYLGKLSTPRELLIMMTEMFARMEAHPEGGLTAQDMEIAVTKALEQAV